jgi:transcriptional regulator with XRE-family HTH domain
VSSRHAINSEPGKEIRRLREDRGLRAIDIERISENVKLQTKCQDFGISHATLNEIEKENSIPNVRKMFSLAVALRVPLNDILALYGAHPENVPEFFEAGPGEISREPFNPAFGTPFDIPFDFRRTGPIGSSDIASWPGAPLRGKLDPSRFSYAWVGTKDDSMADLIPGGSLIEIDRDQREIEMTAWSTLRSRPVYFLWTKDGYRCSWCEEDKDSDELALLPHPASHAPLKRYRRRDTWVRVIGRVRHAWIPIGDHDLTYSLPIGQPSHKL